ncbi:hypothetical protein SeMB42_g02482 [Synchytrium endobioticum]|uniref:Uncharacterized protein n=1 Tax=Synchytrium endobioticum TaxID=286115 RepID=A0A507DEW2_9FUNG|nr:hypothetical protein SeMB42_g02482 [Synchytrium endobioticum]
MPPKASSLARPPSSTRNSTGAGAPTESLESRKLTAKSATSATNLNAAAAARKKSLQNATIPPSRPVAKGSLHRPVDKKACRTLPSAELVAETGIYPHLSRCAVIPGTDLSALMPIRGKDPVKDAIQDVAKREHLVMPRPPTGLQLQSLPEMPKPVTPMGSMDVLAKDCDDTKYPRDPDGAVVKNGELVDSSPACIHMQRILSATEGYDNVLGLVLKLCREFSVHWAEVSLHKFQKLLSRPLLYPITKGDIIAILANRSDVERILLIPANISRKTHELAQIQRAAHRKTSIELHLQFRASWNDIKTKPKLVVHIPSLSCPPNQREKYGKIDTWYWQQTSRLVEFLLDPQVQLLYLVPPGLVHNNPVQSFLDSLGSPIPLNLPKQFESRVRVLQPENGHLLPGQSGCLTSMLMISPWALQEVRAMRAMVGAAYVVTGICGSGYVGGLVTEAEVLSSVLRIPLYSHPVLHHMLTGEPSAQAQVLDICDLPKQPSQAGSNYVTCHFEVTADGHVALVGTTETLHDVQKNILGYRIPQTLADELQVVAAGERVARKYYEATSYAGVFSVEFLVDDGYICVARVFCHHTSSLHALRRFVSCTGTRIDQTTSTPLFDRNKARSPDLHYLSKSPFMVVESVIAAAGMTSETGRDDEPRCGIVIEGAVHPNLRVMSRIALRTICHESGVWFDSLWRVGTLFPDSKVSEKTSLSLICSGYSHSFAAITAIQTLVIASKSVQLPTLPPSTGNFKTICDILACTAQPLPASLDVASCKTVLNELESSMASFLPPDLFEPKIPSLPPKIRDKYTAIYLEPPISRISPVTAALLEASIPSDSLSPRFFVEPPPIEYDYGEFKTVVGEGPEAYLKALKTSIAVADGRQIAEDVPEQKEDEEKEGDEDEDEEVIVDAETTQLGENWTKLVAKRQQSIGRRPGSVEGHPDSVGSRPASATEKRPDSGALLAAAADDNKGGSGTRRVKGVIKGLFVAQNLAMMFKNATSPNKDIASSRVRNPTDNIDRPQQ